MFKNVGKIIQGFAKGILIFNVIAAFAGGIAIFVAMIDIDMGFLGFLLMLSEWATGVMVAIFISHLFYGFGIIVEDHERKLLKSHKNSVSTETKVPVTPVYNNITMPAQPVHSHSATNSATEKAVLADEWKCPVCNAVNKNYVGTCGCGQLKNEVKAQVKISEDGKYKYCRVCGRKQSVEYSTCFVCGEPFV